MTPLNAVRWIKSSYSANDGNCVELAGLADGRVAVRDSKNPDGGMLVLTRAAFTAWIDATRRGALDGPSR